MSGNSHSNYSLIIVYSLLLWIWVWLGGWLFSDILNSMVLGLFFLLSPLLISIIFIRRSNDTFAGIGLSSDLGNNRRLMLRLAIEYFVFVTLTVFIGQILFLDFTYQPDALSLVLFQIIPIFFVVLVQTFAEEIAWAGWLYSKLSALPYYVKVLTISIIWIIWHLPFFLWTEQLIILNSFDIVSLLIIIAHLIILRYLYSWFRWKSENVWWPTILHGLANTSSFVQLNLLSGPDANLPYLLVLVFITNLLFIMRLYFLVDKPDTNTMN